MIQCNTRCLFDGLFISAESLPAAEWTEGVIVYEVIRVIESIPLFLEDHLQRLEESCQASSFSCPSSAVSSDIRQFIQVECHASGSFNFNVKILLHYNGQKLHRIVYKTKHYYPSLDEYRCGVATGLFSWDRQDPSVKRLNEEYQKAVTEEIQKKAVFELLLVSGNGNILEGSRSNVFFIKGERLLSTPEHVILRGITRSWVLKVCKQLHIDVFETMISTEELPVIDAIFLTGTSIKVLPVNRVDEHSFASSQNHIVTAVGQQFDLCITRYIAKHQ